VELIEIPEFLLQKLRKRIPTFESKDLYSVQEIQTILEELKVQKEVLHQNRVKVLSELEELKTKYLNG